MWRSCNLFNSRRHRLFLEVSCEQVEEANPSCDYGLDAQYAGSGLKNTINKQKESHLSSYLI